MRWVVRGQVWARLWAESRQVVGRTMGMRVVVDFGLLNLVVVSLDSTKKDLLVCCWVLLDRLVVDFGLVVVAVVAVVAAAG